MRWIRRILMLAIVVAAIILAASNNIPVILRLVPDGSPLGPLPTIEAPLFAVILVSVFLGIVLGASLEWIRAASSGRKRRIERRQQESLRRFDDGYSMKP